MSFLEVNDIADRHAAAQRLTHPTRAILTERAAQFNLVNRAAFYQLFSAGARILDAVHAHNHALARRLFYHNPIDRGIVIGRHYQKCKLELAHRFSSSFNLAMYMHAQRTQPVHTV